MRKKRLAAAAAAMLLGTSLLFSGCGSTGLDAKLDPEHPVSIQIWHYYNGPQKIAFDNLITEFNETVGKEKGIIVEATSQGNVTELIEKVLDSANKKVGTEEIPDIFAAYADTAYQVDKLGLAASLDAYLTQEELDAYIPGYVEEGRFDAAGSLKIFPTAKSTEIMMLNQTDWDKFSAATGASLEELNTMEGLTRTAKTYYEWTDGLTAAPDDGKAFFGRDAVANYMIIGARQLGVELFTVQNGQVTFQTDEAVMRKLWDQFYVPMVNGWFGAYGRFRSDDTKTGDLIAFVGSTSGSAYFPERVNVSDTESYPIRSTVREAPVFEGGERFAVQQGAGMVVTKSTEEKEYACTVFLKWFTDTQRNLEFSLGSGYLPVKKEAASLDRLEAALAREDLAAAKDSLKKTLPVAIQMTNTYTMYTNKAFEGGTQARDVLEHSMTDLIKSDSRQIAALVTQGTPRAQAAARFTTDAHFQEWLAALRTSLEDCVR